MALSREELESKYGLLREEVGYPYPKIPNKKVASALIAGCGCRFGFYARRYFALRTVVIARTAHDSEVWTMPDNEYVTRGREQFEGDSSAALVSRAIRKAGRSWRCLNQ
jgi:hypothetical protein